MSTHNTIEATRLAPLRTPEGGFAMVALDQRESLREMFAADADGTLVGDSTLRSFKALAGGVLTPYASGVLTDRPLGLVGPQRPDWIAPECGLVLAADVLHGGRFAGVQSTELDPAVTADLIRSTGAAAIKLLVIWRRTPHPDLLDTVDRFLRLARSANVASFLEAIVRPPVGAEWSSPTDRHDAIIEAATELSPGASVYKAEVPGYAPGDLARVRTESERMSSVVRSPWVVLSNGIERDDFLGAVRETLSGGSSGFLAGRAVWADTVNEADQRRALETRSVSRLQALADIVRASMLDRTEVGGSTR